MKSNKYLLQQSGQNYLIRNAKGITTKIGDLPTSGQDGANGTDGKSILTGSGDPSAGFGLNGEVYIDIDNFKLFTKSGGSWSAGTNFNGRSVLFGNGAPLNADGRNLESYIDLDNFKIHTKSAGGSWNAGSLFKGTDGSRGKTILEGEGPPGTSAGNNYATATAALTSALSDAGLSAGDLATGDLYMDTTNHFVYKKTAGGWTKRAATLRGGDGSIGPAGLNAVHASLTQDSYTLLANPNGLSYSLTKASGSFRLRTGFEFIDSSDITFYAGTSGFSTSQTSNGLTLSINSAGKYTLSGDSWSDDSETFTMRAIYSGSTYTKDYSISKSKTGFAGADGLSVRFGAGSPLSALGNNDEVYIDTTNFKLHTKSGGAWNAGTVFSGSNGTNGNDGTGIYTTTSISAGASPVSNTAYGTSKINDLLIDAINHKIYKRSASGATFTWTLQGDQFRGATGATGPAAISGYLSNETHTATANPDGTNYNLTGSGGTFFIFSGSTAVSASNYYVGGTGTSLTSMSNGLTCSINSNGIYTLAGSVWNSDSESFTMRAIFSGSTVTKSYNIVKNKSSKNLELVASALTFSKNGAGSFYPTGQSITLTPQMQNLSGSTITWTMSKIISGTPTTVTIPNTSYITLTAGSSPAASITSTQFNTATGGVIGAQLQITAAHADGVSDTVTLGVVSDGSEADIFCVGLGTAGSATDQYVPYDSDPGGGTGLQLLDLKADVGSLITTSSQTVSFTGDILSVSGSPSGSYNYIFYNAGTSGATTTVTINHRRDSSFSYNQTVFTIARAGQYRITWQGSFKIYNYDPSSTRYTTVYMSMLKSPNGETDYKLQDEIGSYVEASDSGTSRSATRFSLTGIKASTQLTPSFGSFLGIERWRSADYIGKYYSTSAYVNKVTTLSLSVGDRLIFKARRNSYSLIGYDADTFTGNYGSYGLKCRDALETQINANSSSDDELDADIDTIVMLQRIGD
jgi:hypothetical protein